MSRPAPSSLILCALLAPATAFGAGAASWEAQAASAFSAASHAFQAAAPRVGAAAPRVGAAAPRRLPLPAARPCRDAAASVVAESPEDFALGCEGAERASRFMAERGFVARQPVRIFLVDRFPERYDRYGVENMHGFYDTDTREVYMRSLRRFLQTKAESTPLGVPPSRELLVSYIAHETGHHISVQTYAGTCGHCSSPACRGAYCAGAPKLIPRAQGEFISYSLQLATMEGSAREELLRRFKAGGGTAFNSVEQVTLLMHDMDPQGFAVRSYLFFSTPSGAQALLDMMAARVQSPD